MWVRLYLDMLIHLNLNFWEDFILSQGFDKWAGTGNGFRKSWQNPSDAICSATRIRYFWEYLDICGDVSQA